MYIRILNENKFEYILEKFKKTDLNIYISEFVGKQIEKNI